MRVHILVIILSLCVVVTRAASPKESAYSDSIECKAVKMAYEMVKQYFPDKRICVSDTVYLGNYIYHVEDVPPKYKRNILTYDGIDTAECDYYSENLHTLFYDDLSQNNKGDYTVAFSAPYQRMIICGISKYGKPYRDYFKGCNHEFFFLYDEDGVIIKLSATILCD